MSNLADDYNIGDDAAFTFTVHNAAGAPTDPATSELRVKAPSARTGTVVATAPGATGIRTAIVPCTETGVWGWQWATTSPDTGDSGTFYVKPKKA